MDSDKVDSQAESTFTHNNDLASAAWNLMMTNAQNKTDRQEILSQH